MTLTKGRIDRKGRVVFHDAELRVWEEGISDARNTGGWAGEKRWERQFKRDVFSRIVQMLNRLGWSCTVPPIDARDVKSYGGNVARWAVQRRRICIKGDLQGELTISGRCIEFEMWQDVQNVDNPNGGKYDFDKEDRMTYVQRLEMERTRRRICEYLCNVFTGYVFDAEKRSTYRKPLEKTAMERIQQHYAESWHFKGDWDAYVKREGGSLSYNRKSADGAMLNHGQRVWFADHKGRIVKGIAYYNINNMWWVVTGKYDYTNMADFELYTVAPPNIRIKRNAKLRRKRLERELAKAVEKMDFERAAVLRDVAFPGKPALFNVWHDEHQMYHCSDFCGYTRDQSKAGKFTAEEVRNWDHKPNRVVPIVAAKAAA